MKTIALIEKGSDGTYSVYTPHLESTIIGVGKDVTEAQSDFENNCQEVLSAYADAHEELPAELQQLTFEYKMI